MKGHIGVLGMLYRLMESGFEMDEGERVLRALPAVVH